MISDSTRIRFSAVKEMAKKERKDGRRQQKDVHVEIKGSTKEAYFVVMLPPLLRFIKNHDWAAKGSKL